MLSEKNRGDPTEFFRLMKISWLWVLFVSISILGIVMGILSYYLQLKYGEIVTGLRTPGAGGVAWGLYVVFIIFFVGISFGGISTSAAVRILGISQLKPITRVAEFITIVSLILAAMCVLADQGRVIIALINLPRYARVASPMFGTFTMVIAGYLFASLVYFFLSTRSDAYELSKRTKGVIKIIYKIWASGFKGTPEDFERHSKVSFWLAIFILPMLVTAHSTLGFIFGLHPGRPGWFSALQAPSFVIMAGISGIGLIIACAYILNKIYKNSIPPETIRTLGNILMFLTITYIYLMIVEELTANYAAPRKDREIAHTIVFGPYAPYFWITVISLTISFLILFYQFVSGRTLLVSTVISGFLVNVAAFTKRFVLVVPSQTHGFFIPYPEGQYNITMVEILVVIGIVSFGLLAFLVFAKFFPLIPLEAAGLVEIPKTLPSQKKRNILRLSATFGTLLFGLSLMAIGFISSARAFTKYYLDPIIPIAPFIFIIGIIVSFLSAVVYEIIPEKQMMNSSLSKEQ
ncbi:MAG: NrfD/PsrC family molybdoenzyme membrane anchor subunit [Candidatus Pacearchaeota archaeon]